MHATSPTCEESLSIDLANPAVRKALNPERGGSGTMHWAWLGADIASASYVWSGPSARLTLNWIGAGAPMKQTVRLVTTTPNYGGKRWWFVCPVSGRRARALFLPAGARTWASRAAHALPYASQRMSRARRRFERLLREEPRRERRNAMRRLVRRTGIRPGRHTSESSAPR